MFMVFCYFIINYLESFILLKQNNLCEPRLCSQMIYLPLFLQRLDEKNSDEKNKTF